MSKAHEQLRVLLYDSKAKGVLEADLTGKYSALSFSTALHGGFKECQLTVPINLAGAWLYLNRQEQRGRHYHHLEISEDKRIVWEGRVQSVEMVIDSGFMGIVLNAFGYWASLRDQYYSASDVGNTDWTAGGPHVVSTIVKELLTKACPTISTDQSNIDANSRDVVGINLTARDYPQNIIVDTLAPLSDSDISRWYAAVWESQVFHWHKRAVSQVDWYVWLRDISRLSLRQDGSNLRNYILPVVGTAEGTGTLDAGSTAAYPRRELIISLTTGVPGTAANDARDAALADKKTPAQDEAFNISGHVYSARTQGISEMVADTTSGAMVERPKWWVRAGTVLRMQDLVPPSAQTPSLDALRTFYILETHYDAITDTLEVQPDRPPSRLDVLLPRMAQMELNR